MSKRRVYKYRGYTIEELQQMNMDELIDLLPARQRRSLIRGMTPAQVKFYEKIQKRKPTDPKPLRTHLRDFIILPSMVGYTVNVYNGKEYVRARIRPECVGHFLGEFAPTCKIVKHNAPGIGATRSSQYVPLK
ncbi:MAG: 30S ribosomal protein S19 [Candidatus Odinarchaeota archaeon]